MNKKKTKQLEKLLVWKQEGLPETVGLFNELIRPNLFLRELDRREWVLESLIKNSEHQISRHSIFLSHRGLVQLGLTILEAVEKSEDRIPDF